MKKNDLKPIVLGFLLLGMLTLGTSVLWAQAAQDLRVMSIVISKNCLMAFNPDTQLRSLKNPECPRVGDTQLIQITIANFSNQAQRVGMQIGITVDEKDISPKPERVIRTIPPFDQVRILQTYTIPELGGIYEVSASIHDPGFREVLARSEKGVHRRFSVIDSETIRKLKERLEKKLKEIAKTAAPKRLEFEPPDLKWDNLQVLPKDVLREEPFRVRINLVNVGGDIARDISTDISYYNVRLPRRKTSIATPYVDILAPGETATFEVEYLLPDTELLGDYQIIAVADVDHLIRESDKDNNEKHSNVITLSDIKLLLPTESFSFDSSGLFFFQWDSLQYGEFKVQIGIDEKFDDLDNYFELPQGDRWVADKELVPLAGELPSMALGLMRTTKKEQLFWRVVGRQPNGKQSYSSIRTFTIRTEDPGS